MKELKRLDKVAYVRFASVYKNFESPQDFEEIAQSVNRGSANRGAGKKTAKKRRVRKPSPSPEPEPEPETGPDTDSSSGETGE